MKLYSIVSYINWELGIFFGVIYWLDSFGIIGYLGITLWSLFWLAGIITLVEL